MAAKEIKFETDARDRMLRGHATYGHEHLFQILFL